MGKGANFHCILDLENISVRGLAGDNMKILLSLKCVFLNIYFHLESLTKIGQNVRCNLIVFKFDLTHSVVTILLSLGSQ